MKILHAADLHLDSPMIGLERYPGAPVDALRVATRDALENLVALAIDEAVVAVLLAGDLYDGDWKDYNTGLFFVKQMARLDRARIRVFVVQGNHDARSRITRSLRLPGNTRVLSADAPETVFLDVDGEVGLAVHGQSYAASAITANLARGYPDAVPGRVNLGLLHTSADGRAGHEPYAPCGLADLRAKGYDYWALGHVHTREVVSEDPWVVFPGNLQGRHVRETGPKGCSLLTIEDGRIRAVEHRPLDVMRWHLCPVDVGEAADGEQAVALAESAVDAEIAGGDDRLHAVRVELRGATPAHRDLVAQAVRWTAEVRAAVLDRCGERVWIEKVRIETAPAAEIDAALGHEDGLDELLRAMLTPEAGTAVLEEIRGDISELERHINGELGRLGDCVSLLDEAAVDDARALLVPRLLAREDGA